MSTKVSGTSALEEAIRPYMGAIAAAMRELRAIQKANRLTDAEISRLERATKKKLVQIQENLRQIKKRKKR